MNYLKSKAKQKMTKLIDQVWLWGQTPGSHHATAGYHLPGVNKMTPLEGCDFFGIRQIHGQLIRPGTCGNSGVCDYLVVGSENPIAMEYETVMDEGGFLVSRKKNR